MNPARVASVRVTAALVLLGLAPTADAASIGLTNGNSGQVIRWHQTTVGYLLNSACSPDISQGACLDALRDSFGMWESPCSALNLVEQGTTSNKKIMSVGYSSNGSNEVAFIEDQQWSYGGWVLGLTSYQYGSDGAISEADIAFNGLQHTWSTTGAGNTTDVMNVAVHEIGHFFGLRHVLGGYHPDDPPTMAPEADNNLKSRTPEADDLAGLCFLYPAAGSFNCSSNDDCPAVVDKNSQGDYYVGVLACEGGLCGGFSNEIPQGTSDIGDACSGDYDCIDPWFCQPINGASGVCAAECATANPNCPAGFECVPYSNAPGSGVCLEASGGGGDTGGGTTATKELGAPCDSSLECKSQLCLNAGAGYLCHQPCGSSNDCAAGEYCASIPGASYGGCIASGGDDGPTKQNGEPCSDSGECIGGICAGSGSGYACTEACTSGAQCPEGYDCFALSNGGGACFEVENKGVGAPCDYNSDCASGQCVAIGDGPWVCNDACGSDADCPCGMGCVDLVGGESMCDFGAKVACVPLDEPCGGDSECISGTCHGGECAQGCSIFQGGGVCRDGEGCQQLAEDSPEGVCAAAGPNELGASCGQDNACQSLFCVEWHCAQPCDPVGLDLCPVGEVCEPLTNTVGTCALAPEPEPEPEPETGDETGDATGAETGGGADTSAAETGGATTGADDTGDGSDTGDGTPEPIVGGTGETGDDGGDGGGGGGGGGSSGCSAGTDGPRPAPGPFGLALTLALATALAVRRRRLSRVA